MPRIIANFNNTTNLNVRSFSLNDRKAHSFGVVNFFGNPMTDASARKSNFAVPGTLARCDFGELK